MLDRTKPSLAYIKATAKTFTIPFSFIISILTLYLFEPNSFQYAWVGRAPYIFFMWLFSLELVLAWRKLPKNTFDAMTRKKILAIVATVTIPSFYIICTHMSGLNQEVIEAGKILGVWPHNKWFAEYAWPLSLEYLLFASFFTASIWLAYGIKGLKRFSVSLFLLGATCFFYMINTFYPYGTFTALQSLLPVTTSSASQVLRWMGYRTLIVPNHYYASISPPVILDMPILHVIKGELTFSAAIFWPCAGINSLFIYTFAILLFLKDISLSHQPRITLALIPMKLRALTKSKRMASFLEHKILHTAIVATEKLIVNLLKMTPFFIIFAIGAAGTYLVNILRVVSICIIGVNNGEAAAEMFHSYYGELFFIVWILTYPMIVIYGPKIWKNIKSLWKTIQ